MRDIVGAAAMCNAVFQALYALAIKRVIPPELKLDVDVTVDAAGTASIELADDLRNWLKR